MYTLIITGFLYPEDARGERFSGQHTICFRILFVFLSKHRADRFLLGWLFLHRRLRSRQRGSFAFAPERLSLSSRWFLAEKCFPFLSGEPEKVFQPFLEPSLSASIQGVIVTFFRLLLLSNGASPLRSPLPVPVKKPVSIFDCIWSLHPFFFMSSRKYFKFCLYFTGFFYKSVENFRPYLWKKLWKTLQAISIRDLKFWAVGGKKSKACVKVEKKASKKIFYL
jgi:hypothetical protein